MAKLSSQSSSSSSASSRGSRKAQNSSSSQSSSDTQSSTSDQSSTPSSTPSPTKTKDSSSSESQSSTQSKSPKITSTPQIDALPDYSAIADCARTPLSQIVIDFTSGCGKAEISTSYNCFCNQHSSSVNSLISAGVQTACSDAVLVGQAQAVFSEYCDLGTTPLTEIPQVIATPTTTPSTRAKPSTATATATVTTTSQVHNSFAQSTDSSSSSSSGGLSQSTVIAIGVCIPIVVVGLAIGLAALLLWRRRRILRNHKSFPPISSPQAVHQLYPPPGFSGGSDGPPTLDTRTASDVSIPNKSPTDYAPEPGIRELFTPLPPVHDVDEDAKVAPLVPARSPLRSASQRSQRPLSEVNPGTVSRQGSRAGQRRGTGPERPASADPIQSTDRRGTF